MVNDSDSHPTPMNPAATAAKEKGTALMLRVKAIAFGLAADFWKDTPCEFPKINLKLGKKSVAIPNIFKPLPPGGQGAAPIVVQTASATAAAGAPKQKWHALPGEIAEKMWGEGTIYPLGDAMLDLLIKPLALNKDKFVLDLTAGLGGPLRKLSAIVHNLKGLESDHVIAARGMELSTKAGKAKQAPIEAYDPATFSMPAIYHCIVAREIFYRIPDMGKFFYSITAGLKEKGQIAFTDYIIDPENRAKPAIAAWQAYEKGARPLGLIEMAEAWAREGVEIRVSDDQTTAYRAEIVAGINRFVSTLRHAPPPDLETKQAILKEVELWVHRLAAFQAGMKFYRFHALKS